MTKSTLHLTIETNLIEIAKASGLNLSQEFEEWIKIRLGQIDDGKPIIDIDMEIAKYQAEIQKLKSQAELNKEIEFKGKEENMILDNSIDNMKQFEENLANPSDTRIHGIQFLMQKKFNKILNPLEAKELLLKRIKELENA